MGASYLVFDGDSAAYREHAHAGEGNHGANRQARGQRFVQNPDTEDDAEDRREKRERRDEGDLVALEQIVIAVVLAQAGAFLGVAVPV